MAGFGRMTRMSDFDKKRIRESERLLANRISYFGSDKARVDFTVEVSQSIGRFERARRHNLFAIIMPACSGKTTLCEKFGFIDIDKCCWGSEHEILNSMRLDCIAGRSTWDSHNELWLKWVNDTLDQFEFKQEHVIMCHSEIIALSIGALPLAGFAPDDRLFESCMSDMERRDNPKANRARASLARVNRAEFFSHSLLVMKNKRVFSSYSEAENLVLRTLVINDIPCACPYKYQESFKAVHYSDSCPRWVQEGDKSRLDIHQLLSMYEGKMVPKECMDYFLRTRDIPASYGFGIRDFEWSEFLAIARTMRSSRGLLDKTADPAVVFPYLYSKNETRANVTMSRLVKGLDIYNNDDVVDIISHHIGKPNNFVAAVVCWWLGIGSTLESRHLIKELLKTSYVWWGELFKMFHGYIRLSERFMDTVLGERERQGLMYIQLLVGKEVEEADYMEEVRERTCSDPEAQHLAYDPDLGLWTKQQYAVDFSKALNEAYVRMDQRQVDVSGFAELYELRGSWLTKGSTVYNQLDRELLKCAVDIVDEVGTIIRRTEVRHNKKSLFEMAHVLEVAGDDLELLNATKMVTKLDECGHTRRALFPGSLLHYIIFSYVLYCAEKQGQVGNVRLNAEPDDDITYFEEKMAVIPRLLFDWANFNAYHSTNEMSEVVRRLGSRVPGPGDYADFCWVIADQMYNMKLIDPVGEIHELGQGLFSGWRGTTFINTVLNCVYVRCAEESFIRIYKHEPFLYVDGGGDDLDTGTNRYDDGYKILWIMSMMRFRSKQIKQMIDVKSEFFRVTINKDGCFASPTRALAMFVNGKWEGSGEVPITQRIGGLLDQIAKIVRRGMDSTFGASLAVVCLAHWCKVNVSGDWLDLPGEVIHGQLSQNGLGVPDRDGNVWKLDVDIPLPVIPEAVGSVPGSLASMDYLHVLVRELRVFSVEVIDEHKAACELAADSFDIYDKVDFTPLLEYRGCKIGDVRVVDDTLEDEEVFSCFTTFMATYKRNKNLAKVERYACLVGNLSFNGRKIDLGQLMDIMQIDVKREVMDFKADVYHRRLVAEPIARAITDFCLEIVDRGSGTCAQAMEVFKILCVMCSKRFKFNM
nr:MAG: putative RNA-dependent RNA polymerase [Alphachrysovirus sp.]